MDADGLITKADLLIATGQNNQAMNLTVDQAARHFLKRIPPGTQPAEGISNRLEAAIRCYDPRLSCSTHALGQMPLVVEWIGADGRPLGRIAREVDDADLALACGDPLRGDDGAAHAAVRLIPAGSGGEMRSIQQLTPELAQDIGGFDRVVFLDADAASDRVVIEPIDVTRPRSPLTHVSTQAEIVALARALFGFTGEGVRLLHLPARDFSPGDAPRPETAQFARQAAHELTALL